MIETDQLLFERRGSTAFITFNRPEARNAMTWEMYDALFACCEEVDADDAVRVLVLRGAGDKAFVAGTDIKQFLEFESGEDGVVYEERMERIVGRLETVRKPTVAVIDGYAIGGGLAIAAVSDLRVCTPEAKFGMPIARTLGNCLSVENYARLVALLGPARTKALIFTARMISAEEALAAGFATEVVPREELDGRVEELCVALASHAPITLRVTKEAVRRLTLAGLPDVNDLVVETYGSADFRKGVEAFVEKRRPKWSGR
ncbi:MAG TPA: enoyl-CoA hydratase/isomerase family protein [Rubrobacteraceae bacterium]|nr:enoyl-CoA hydratase/isomerase family protein [Rubrobacteraceae bacterium]